MDNIFNSDVENFLLMAQYKSLSAVSRRTGQDIGGLSRSLGKLEKDLGKILFIRMNTGLKLTQEGAKFLEAFKAGKHSFQKELANLDNAQLRIGFSNTIGFSYFKEEYFKVLRNLNLSPEFQIHSTVRLFDMLKSRELDLIFAPKEVKFPESVNVSLASDKIVLVSSTGKVTKTLLWNSQMIEIEKALKKIKCEVLWDIQDYFVMAKFLSVDSQLMGLLPYSLLETFKSLKTVDEFSHVGKVQAISWKGSTGVMFLKALRKKANASNHS